MKIVIINALPKLQLLPFCFVGQHACHTWWSNSWLCLDFKL